MISNLKQIIMNKLGYPTDLQSLIYNGRSMQMIKPYILMTFI